MSRGVYRGIYSALVDDPDFQRLSPAGRLLFYTARFCAQAGPAVIFRYYPEVLVRQTGLTKRQVEAALAELERETWIVREGVILWVRNGLRHDPALHLSDPKHRAAVMRACAALPRLSIVLTFCDYYQLPRPFEGPSKALARPSEGPSKGHRRALSRTRNVVSSRRDSRTTAVREVIHAAARARGTDGAESPAPPAPDRSAHAPDPTSIRSAPDPTRIANLIDGAIEKHSRRAAARVADLKRAEGKLPPVVKTPPPATSGEDAAPF